MIVLSPFILFISFLLFSTLQYLLQLLLILEKIIVVCIIFLEVTHLGQNVTASLSVLINSLPFFCINDLLLYYKFGIQAQLNKNQVERIDLILSWVKLFTWVMTYLHQQRSEKIVIGVKLSNAPFLKLRIHLPFEQVPSGKTSIGNTESSFDFSNYSILVFI